MASRRRSGPTTARVWERISPRIGTTNPQEKLEVNGNILATGDVILTGADCAEDFDVKDAQALEPGTVMVIGDEDRLTPIQRSLR